MTAETLPVLAILGGTGDLGTGLARRWAQAGYQVIIGSRSLEKAEAECLADHDVRARRREREAARRAELDQEYVKRFAQEVRRLYPNCPPDRETAIAEHACLKYSGRVGRSAAAKDLDEEAVSLAVVAHVRHTETDYDRLLAHGYDRHDARAEVKGAVDDVLSNWAGEENA